MLNNEGRRNEMKPHQGINSSSIAGEGFEGLPGLILAIAFVFFFIGIFLPKHSNWPLAVFALVEIGAATLYIVIGRRNRADSERAWKALHEINEEHPAPGK
jgi:hypothetical protein